MNYKLYDIYYYEFLKFDLKFINSLFKQNIFFIDLKQKYHYPMEILFNIIIII